MIYSCKSLWTCLVHCIVKSSSKIWFVKSSSKIWFSIIYLFIKTQATPFLRTLRSNVPLCNPFFINTIAACLLDSANASIDGSKNLLKVLICISVHWTVFSDHVWIFERLLLEQKIDASLTSADLWFIASVWYYFQPPPCVVLQYWEENSLFYIPANQQLRVSLLFSWKWKFLASLGFQHWFRWPGM